MSTSEASTTNDLHPFLRGNFAPVTEEYISHPCPVTLGSIPSELLGGQYIRNGGNPVYPPHKGRHYHWFDGDGMLHGVLMPTDPDSPPMYTNRHLATPLLDMTLLILRSPIPSIALLILPLSSLHRQISAIVTAFILAIRGRLGVLSVANTNVIWWGQGLGIEAGEEAKMEDGSKTIETEQQSFQHVDDHRLLATCESGPPLEVRLPELETVGWDRLVDSKSGEDLARRRGRSGWWTRFGLPRDWMTAHPRIDPIDGSLLFYSTNMFEPPHARYSVIDRKGQHLISVEQRCWSLPLTLGMLTEDRMHDFAATRSHTILLNLPLTLSPSNLFSLPPLPLIHFDRSLPSEFIIFPRLLGAAKKTREVFRFVDPEPCLIFHTANAWDEYVCDRPVAINMLACRFKSAKLVYSVGAVEIPKAEKVAGEDDVVQLHYYRFEMPTFVFSASTTPGNITHSFPLSAIPFEFPTVTPDKAMSAARYVYGCTMGEGSFDERLGGAAKVDCLVKMDVGTLVDRGRARGSGNVSRPVDERSSSQILSDWATGKKGPIEIFQLPPKWYAQEPRFVPRNGTDLSEDDGYLISYVYDESYIDKHGTPSNAPNAGSEFWVIDAKTMGSGMSAVICRIKLPQRVPYGCVCLPFLFPKQAEG
ncbi:hypothetical protein TREMEDRAFT_30937 [Tremella mesenterica DSM 1558]|uniref:uncharacterized protein n=1 Tax=Tremella mesenterica (strain ATCC 24925 / CBS 8224 / DSM 1558 / NBRC 9311 / NRRL Y-6157 / RJB 2259-6 / UBC 559-6) TaxID=578456 RepID=UPI0003F490B7|nr:uncharacterized protein TREMEDRAFT_30937 [Tremella mesenterica DSM 1558]EIW69469.1 hypothetical protein TREMEDRAFT_30937 [Tremella mesenterica DSM 1558]